MTSNHNKNAGDDRRTDLVKAARKEPDNPTAWIRLAGAATSDAERRAALYRALLLAPDEERIANAYRALHSVNHYRHAAQTHGGFMCYNRADELFTAELAETLKSRDLPVWVDIFDVPMDADWNATVKRAMDDSGVVLLVLSPDAVASEMTRNEVSYALRAGKLVLPLLHHACNPSPMKLLHPVIDFRTDYRSAVRMVFALLGITSRQG